MSEKKVKNELKDVGQGAVTSLLNQVISFADLSQTPLSPKDKAFAVDIITNTNKKLMEDGISWNNVNIMGCQFPQQIKSMARLGLSVAEKEIYIDVRYNKNSPLKDITIKKQYQGVRKELIKFCSKKIDRFYNDVVCDGDDFVMETDFMSGLKKVIKHTKNNDIDRNNLDNIIGAYEIAYVKEDGVLNQYLAYIDKHRIMRAYNASPSNTKTVWKADTVRMVLKTASWVMYNDVLKPYVNVPSDLLDDWKATSDNLEFDEKNEELYEDKTISFDDDTGEVQEAVVEEHEIKSEVKTTKKKKVDESLDITEMDF